MKNNSFPLNSFEDLVTTYEATRAGFVMMALEKNRKATPVIAQARSLQNHASKVNKPKDLLDIEEIKSALLTASGVSTKASRHFSKTDIEEILLALIENFLEPAGKFFVEELVFRFLLTKGDSLGGSVRNLAGSMGERKLTRAFLAELSVRNIEFYWLDNQSRKWIPSISPTENWEFSIKGLSWSGSEHQRTLLTNINIPFINKNVDYCLFDIPHTSFETSEEKKTAIKNSSSYIALGELKAGIDPAGADEHWKTANSALGRIKNSFTSKGFYPYIFFIGAAIEKSMAKEIFEQLVAGNLSKAANLTNDKQVAAFADWLISI